MNASHFSTIAAWLAIIGGAAFTSAILSKKIFELCLKRYIAIHCLANLASGQELYWDHMVKIYESERVRLLGIPRRFRIHDGWKFIRYLGSLAKAKGIDRHETFCILFRNLSRSMPNDQIERGAHLYPTHAVLIYLFCVCRVFLTIRGHEEWLFGVLLELGVIAIFVFVFLASSFLFFRGFTRVWVALRKLERQTGPGQY